MSWEAIRDLAQGARGSDENGYRAEFMQLIDMARVLVVPTVTSEVPDGGCVAADGMTGCPSE